MKKVILFSVIAFFCITSSSEAQSGREHDQYARHGKHHKRDHGRLTKPEMDAIKSERRNIKLHKKIAAGDGRITRKEAHRIRKMEHRAAQRERSYLRNQHRRCS